MPNLPISGLPAITVPNNTYVIPAVSASVTAQMNLAQVAAAISSSFTASQAVSASYALTASFWGGGSSYVPYTGATANVDLGTARTLRAAYLSASAMDVNDSFRINGDGTTNGGTLQFKQYGSIVGGLVNRTTIGAANDDQIILTFYQTGSTNYKSVYLFNSLVPDDSSVLLNFPSASGTLALKSDAFPYTGSARITGSLGVTGSLNVTGSITAANFLTARMAFISDSVNNTFIGGGVPDRGNSNVALGSGAFLNGSIGSYNVSISTSLRALVSGSSNIAIGRQALAAYPIDVNASASGSYNIAIGEYAMWDNTQARYNVALGLGALRGSMGFTNNVDYNIAIGHSASFSASSAVNNITIGYLAGSNIATGSYNTIIGYFTGSPSLSNTIVLADGQGNVGYKYSGSKAEITGSLNISGSITAVNTVIANRASIFDANYNTLIGGGVGVTGANNLALGDSGLLNGTIGNYNIAIGSAAQAGVNSGSYNISMGLSALEAYPTIGGGANSGSYNTAIGNYAMQYIGQGSYNVALGQSALQGYTARTGSASYNIAIGVSASFSASSAINNTTIGYRAGANITTGNYNTIIGSTTGSTNLTGTVLIADGQGNLAMKATGSIVTLYNVLQLPAQDPLPAASLYPNSFAVSASTPTKPYYSDGTSWNALY